MSIEDSLIRFADRIAVGALASKIVLKYGTERQRGGYYPNPPPNTTTTALGWRLRPAFTAGGAAFLLGAARPFVA